MLFMEKRDVLSFHSFHHISQNYFAVPQYKIYNVLFQWAYPDGDVPEACVSRWCTGYAPVKNVVLRLAARQPDREFDRYSKLWENLVKLEYVHCPDTLSASLRDEIRKDVSQQKKRLPKAGHDLLAYALVQALGNDYIMNKIDINPSLLSAFQTADKQCRSAGIPLRAPYILNVLLDLPDSRLLQTLNRLRPELGSHYAEEIRKYVQRKNHGGAYEGWDAAQSAFLFYAKKEAFLDNRDTAEELDIVTGLLYSHSSTVEKLLDLAGGRETLIAALHSNNTTSIPM